ncbi:SulP family inorganic anion transporter [Solirubrobacter taibaiensis]|nr:SulP family inorganic anion transporter [Solirubrobacter taibaiensis]
MVAGIVVWSVVVPQAVAYGQIAGLPPEAGLMAAPGALVGYALLGTSRTLIVSATTATSALSAAAVGPLADGDPLRYAALSAALGLLAGVVLVLGGLLGLGAVSDFVSKPVMTGFLFGLGLVVMEAQLDALTGDNATTVVFGVTCIVILLAFKFLRPGWPAMSIVVAGAIVVSWALNLSDHGVAVVGEIPRALPDPAWPDVNGADLVALLPMAFGVLILSTEAVGVSRALAAQHHYEVDTSRDLAAMGASNLLAGFSSGFVQSGGASQTAAAENAGGRTQLTALVAAGLILLTGAFLGPLFTDLPNTALAAIVIVAVSSFLNVPELRRLAALRRSAIVLAGVAGVAVVGLGVLEGLIVTAAISLAIVIKRLSRPHVTVRDGVVTPHAPLFYANSHAVREIVRKQPGPVTLDLQHSFDLDVESVDMLADLKVPLVNVHPHVAEMLSRRGSGDLVRRS